MHEYEYVIRPTVTPEVMLRALFPSSNLNWAWQLHMVKHITVTLTEASEVAWSLAVAELTLAVKASRASRNGV